MRARTVKARRVSFEQIGDFRAECDALAAVLEPLDDAAANNLDQLWRVSHAQPLVTSTNLRR